MLQALTGFLSGKTADLEARLVGVAGFTGYGELEYTAYRSGRRLCEVELRGAAGRSAEVFADGVLIGRVEVANGRTDQFFDSRRGHALPPLEEGARIEIRQNGDVILEGALARD